LDAGDLQHRLVRGPDDRPLVQRPRRRLPDRSDLLALRRHRDRLTQGVRRAILAAALLVGGAAAHPAQGAPRLRAVDLSVYYGPACHKQYGSTNCLTDRIDGITVAVLTYPGLKRLAVGTSRGGFVQFTDGLPFNLAFVFDGRTHGRRFRGAWRL